MARDFLTNHRANEAKPKQNANYFRHSIENRSIGIKENFSTSFYFCAVQDYVIKVAPSKGYQNPERKLGVTTHFSEIAELKFGKKLPYIPLF